VSGEEWGVQIVQQQSIVYVSRCLTIVQSQNKMKRRQIIRAFTSNCSSCLPTEVVFLILEFAYDVRCSASAVQYWFFLHEPFVNENLRRSKAGLRQAGKTDPGRLDP
jgi:hypothetical protein